MRNRAESGQGGRDEVTHPLLVEFDHRGQVLWMSERMRSVLDEADQLLETRSDTDEPAERECVHGLLNLQANLSDRLQIQRRGMGRSASRQVEQERQRLARELHTGVGQMLAAIRLQGEIIARQLRDPSIPVAESLSRIATLSADALEQVRWITQRLHPPQWQRLTLEAALAQLWEISGLPEKFETCLRIDTLPREPDLEIKVLMYRGAQEALSNLTRHSHASRIGMSLAASGGRLVLTIEDNGVGFDVAGLFSAPAKVAVGIGLRSIRDQADALGGWLEIQSGPKGTKVEVSAPLSLEDTAAAGAA